MIKWKSIFGLPFFLFLTVVSLLHPDDFPIVAVPGLKETNVSKSVVSACRSIVETALIKTERFSVLSYTDIEKILAAQEFSLSDCTDEACAVEIGKLLAAEQIVVGEISGIGETFILSLRLVDVSTGKSLKAESIQINSIDDLQDQTYIATYALVGLKYIPEAEIAVKETGEIYVTAPEGKTLDVYLDGDLLGQTPILLQDISFGIHILEAKQGDYYFNQEISIKSKEVQEVFADVQLLKGNLLLQISPSEAQGYSLLLNGKEYRPGLIKDLSVGKIPVKVEGNGWFYKGNITVEQGKTTKEVISLMEVGNIRIDVPQGSKTELMSVGKTIQIEFNQTKTVQVGKYNLSITHPDYEEYQTEVEIFQDQMTLISPVLKHNIAFQISELEIEKERILRKRKGFSIAGWSSAGVSILGAIAMTVFEILIWQKVDQLNETYAQYESETVGVQIDILGGLIDEYKQDIQGFRTARNVSIIGTGVPAIASGIFFMLRPSTIAIDERINSLKETME